MGMEEENMVKEREKKKNMKIIFIRHDTIRQPYLFCKTLTNAFALAHTYTQTHTYSSPLAFRHGENSYDSYKAYNSIESQLEKHHHTHTHVKRICKERRT